MGQRHVAFPQKTRVLWSESHVSYKNTCGFRHLTKLNKNAIILFKKKFKTYFNPLALIGALLPFRNTNVDKCPTLALNQVPVDP